MEDYYKIPPRIWKDKHIQPEGKIIYSYIYSKGFDKLLINLNVGELQQVVKINNVGLKKVLQKLESNQYLLFQEYDTGMYTINLLGCK
jgi:hypothetical protein